MRGRRTDTGRRKQAIDALKAAGANGLTTDELVAASGIIRDAASGRISELKTQGIIKDSGLRRRANSGKMVTVWVLATDEVPLVIETAEKELPTVSSHPPTFWTDIRRQIVAFVLQGNKNVDEGSRFLYLRDLDSDIKAAVSHFTGRMNDAKTPLTAPISRRKLLDACEALRVPIPPVGKPVNLEIAKKNKRHASRLYHPDVTGNGNETTRALFEAAVEAYSVLEQYNQTQEQNNGR